MPQQGKANVGGVGPGTSLKVASLNVTGVATEGGGSNTAPGAAVSSPAVVSGVAFTPSATTDSMVYLQITATGAGTFTVTMGPATGAENTLANAVALLATGNVDVPSYRVPAGWKMVVTVVTATITQTRVVTC